MAPKVRMEMRKNKQGVRKYEEIESIAFIIVKKYGKQ
jgi:hypothetical protein